MRTNILDTEKAMLTTDFSFELPEELVAQSPAKKRGQSRLLVLDKKTGAILHSKVDRLVSYIPQNAVMVFNDSKVRRARLFAKTAFGGSVELLLLRREYGSNGDHLWAALASRMAKLKPGSILYLPDGMEAEVIAARPDERLLCFSREISEAYLDTHGHLPLPPYIKRMDGPEDRERYQTVYAREYGSAAAPTAGLHFTDSILGSLKEAGIKLCFITLHVGLGTFLPVRSSTIEGHKMHYEDYNIPPETAEAVNRAKTDGQPVIAVGTTSVRSLESAWSGKSIRAGFGSTDIFIYPGYQFKLVDSLFTNFHTPESTLLMLVSAFAGKDRIMAAYKDAVKMGYSFFSYGDAMLIR